MVDFAKLLAKSREPRVIPTVPRLCIGITGHRPHKLDSSGLESGDPGFNGYDRSNPLRVRLREEIRLATQALLDRPVERCRPNCYTDADYLDTYLRRVEWRDRPVDLAAPIAFSGVALGVDTDACGVWLRMGLPYVALVPFEGQELRWPRESQAVYSEVLRRAAGVYVCHDGRPTSDAHAGELLKKRDEVLCCVADELIAVWDGSRGGTSHTVRKWDGFGGPGRLHRIDPREFR